MKGGGVAASTDVSPMLFAAARSAASASGASTVHTHAGGGAVPVAGGSTPATGRASAEADAGSDPRCDDSFCTASRRPLAACRNTSASPLQMSAPVPARARSIIQTSSAAPVPDPSTFAVAMPLAGVYSKERQPAPPEAGGAFACRHTVSPQRSSEAPPAVTAAAAADSALTGAISPRQRCWSTSRAVTGIVVILKETAKF